MRILTADEMREVDRRAIEEIGIPGMVLMENAALGVVEAVADHFPDARDLAILCGPGNNGGDGMAVARLLDARGYAVRVFLVLHGSEPQGDAATQLAILRNSGFRVEEVRQGDDLGPVLVTCRQADLWIDALFGTGLSRPLGGHYAALLEAFAGLPIPCLAVDLPSGLDAGRAEPIGPCARADVSVTFAAPKIAHLFAPAADAVGEVVVADLGIPSFLLAEAPGNLHLSTADELAAYRLPRGAATHKGDYGHVLLVGGSPGKAGAMILASRAAVRGGAGLVTAAVPSPILNVVDGGSIESMTLALPADADGGLALPAADLVLQAADGKQAVAIGPGLGLAEPTLAAVRRLARDLPIPLVLDADGLAAFAGRLGDLAERSAPTVLTPHPGEMGRLLGMTSADVQADRLGAARRAAAESGAVVVLKGHQTLISEPDGETWLNPTGNAGMATGGTGDVLTGLVAALLGQGYEAAVAARLAVFLHGAAGDLAAERLGGEALRAGDLVEALAQAFELLE